ncbi:pyridoxal reductase [Phlyctema vagabunda]|uniref:Pyridoxal reductase n=1 Tax=Phlyctema vagabunda TaxID=108571 RepID=A0ABR4PRB3_9HELO
MATLAGKAVTKNGFGLMSTTALPDEETFKVLKAALACGANIWNGADFYGTPESNSLHLANRYFTKYPEDADKVVLCIKTGVVDMKTFKLDCSPQFMRQKADELNKILDGKKTLDIFGPARVDPDVPIERTMEGLAELLKEKKIGGIQLTEVRAETIRRASNIAKVDMVEAEVSLWATEVFSNGVAETCGELGILISAYTPLGAGMLTGQIKSLDDLPENDFHRMFPRFFPENFEKNLDLVNEIQKLAKAKGCSPAQLAISWVQSHNGKPGMPLVVPIAGARSEERVRENCAEVQLDEKDLKEIQSILDSFPVAGARWPAGAAKFAEY